MQSAVAFGIRQVEADATLAPTVKAPLPRPPQSGSSISPEPCAPISVSIDQDPSLPALLGDGHGPSHCRVVRQLGRGGEGSVYLATQPALANRPVVLKVTPCRGREYLSLARLQHTNIVPLYWVHDDAAQNRRILCMPYFGSVTLEHARRELGKCPPARRTGRHLVDLLQQSSQELATVLPHDAGSLANPAAVNMGSVNALLARASYAQAVCWLGACLADALHYAHERGLIHCDVKPSNILLANDGQPMLLDFHLARPSIPADDPNTRGIGGTPAYMSPEQRAAFLAAQQGRPAPQAVDGRSDVFALGLVLREMLAGAPENTKHTASHEGLSDVFEDSPGLAAILNKCLAPAADLRYATAAALAADLRRHLNDLPLQGVANPSWRERWRKWRRRRPLGLPLLLCLVLTASALGAAATLIWSDAQERQRQAAVALRLADEHAQKKEWTRAVETLERGSALVENKLGGGTLHAQLRHKLAEARQQAHVAQTRQALEQFHLLLDKCRFWAGQANPPSEDCAKLASTCAALWQVGKKLWQEQASVEAEPSLRQDLLDLATLWARLLVQKARGAAERGGAARQALLLLAEAERLCGGSPLLYHERQLLAETSGAANLAKAAAAALLGTRPSTVWEHTALARAHLQHGAYSEAQSHLEAALALDPRAFWPQFYLGAVRFRQERFQDALLAFHGCIMLSSETPDAAHVYFNRGLVWSALGRQDRALADYEHALQLDPHLTPARVNRDLLREMVD